MEQSRMGAESLFDLSAFYLAELLNLLCVLEVVDEAKKNGECSVEVMDHACAAFLYAADRIRADVLKERLVFRTSEDDGLVYSDTNVFTQGRSAQTRKLNEAARVPDA
jgi:hypothetical protein